MGYSTSDNNIFYFAGPMYISISGWSEEITITTTTQWCYLLPEILTVAIEAWGLTDNDFILCGCDIKIKINFKILKLYIEHAIIFL